MKRFIIKYLLYVYKTYIQNDYLDIVKDWVIPYVKVLLFISNIYFWLLSIALFPILVIDMKIKEFTNFNK